MKVKSESEVAQSCPTLSDPMDCSLPGSSAHGILQARVLEWVPLPSLKDDTISILKMAEQRLTNINLPGDRSGVQIHVCLTLKSIFSAQDLLFNLLIPGYIFKYSFHCVKS